MSIKSIPHSHSLKSGFGLRSNHYRDILSSKPDVGFLEIHPENYFGYGIEHYFLEQIAELYPISFHGVGLSLGSTSPVSKKHLSKILELIKKYNPIHFSEHLAWSISGNAHLNDLLPLPYTKESLKYICDNINQAQDFLSQQIIIENPSTYLEFNNSMPEEEFLCNIISNTQCGLLLDVNNIFVTASNHDHCPFKYIDAINPDNVYEIHLSGHSKEKVQDKDIFIDTHDNFVSQEVWKLFEYTINKIGTVPTIIEWDDKLPTINELELEAKKADNIINHYNKKQNAA